MSNFTFLWYCGIWFIDWVLYFYLCLIRNDKLIERSWRIMTMWHWMELNITFKINEAISIWVNCYKNAYDLGNVDHFLGLSIMPWERGIKLFFLILTWHCRTIEGSCVNCYKNVFDLGVFLYWGLLFCLKRGNTTTFFFIHRPQFDFKGSYLLYCLVFKLYFPFK